MTLKFIPLTQIKLNPNNPRKIDKGRKDVIMKICDTKSFEQLLDIVKFDKSYVEQLLPIK